jgi:hypothetical protein
LYALMQYTYINTYMSARTFLKSRDRWRLTPRMAIAGRPRWFRLLEKDDKHPNRKNVPAYSTSS